MLYRLIGTEDEVDPPVGGAFLKPHVYKADITDPQLFELNSRSGLKDNWYSNVINHRYNGGLLTRDLVRAEWFVEIGTIDELTSIVEKNNRIVIERCYRDPNLYELKLDNYIKEKFERRY